jgi:hypothetical protein
VIASIALTVSRTVVPLIQYTAEYYAPFVKKGRISMNNLRAYLFGSILMICCSHLWVQISPSVAGHRLERSLPRRKPTHIPSMRTLTMSSVSSSPPSAAIPRMIFANHSRIVSAHRSRSIIPLECWLAPNPLLLATRVWRRCLRVTDYTPCKRDFLSARR